MNKDIPKNYKLTEVGVIPTDWDVKKLSELTSLITNGFVGIVKSQYTEDDDGVIYIQGYNVEENSFNFRGIKKVTFQFHKQHSKSCLQEGDLLTIQTGNVGLTTIVPKELEGTNCHALIISRFKKAKSFPKYFSLYLNSNQGRARLKEIEVGTTMKHINVGDMIHFLVPVPNKTEQTAIATALTEADALISGIEKLIAKKRDIKQGAMQKLLSPTEGWAVKTLGEVLKIKHGKSQKEIEDVSGQYPILGTGGLMSYGNQFLYDKPSVLIGRKGTIDKPQYMDTPFWTVDTLFYTEINEKHNAKFIFYMFNLIDWYSYNEASGVPSLNGKTIEKIERSFPPLEEQTRIATILSDMDAEIATLEKKLEKYRAVKAGMMQNLLTGRIRLV
jgi:type I restriction enzyme, S subunit